MTTIAVDKTHIAWDAQLTWGDEKVSYPVDKVWTADGKVYAFAGSYGLLEAVVAWHRAGARAKSAPNDPAADADWEILVITKKGASLYSRDIPRRMPVGIPFAIGTGAHYARGAMLARASAYRAVKIACMCDVYSGGEVAVLELSTILK